jgi:CPA2 family monovalent cation:H+ antiporter-2
MATMHDLPLVSTIAAGLGGAFVLGLICSKLRIPPIVGYLMVGIIIGPHTPGFVADLKLAEQLAEIGIVLLMFGVGLHFSIKDLMEVKRIAVPGAIFQMAAAIAMGVGLSHLWDWPLATGFMFGLALSVASTVVLLRSLEEHNLTHTTNGRIAIGWLIVEDIVMVLALVMIPAFAVSSTAVGAGEATSSPWMHLLTALLKLGAFVVFMLVVGKRVLPWLLETVVKTRSRELFTLAVFAVAVGLAFGATQIFGVSLALGAFFAGMMIRESDLNHEVADRALPFQDAFAVLFFVAVGMLFNPAIMIEQPLNVVAVTAVIMVGKSVASFLLVTLFGYPLKTGLLVSAGLAQIGEFSFILITLGMAYGLMSEDAQNLILAGAMISIALNPLTFYYSKRLYTYMGKNEKLSSFFNMRDDDLAHLTTAEETTLKDLVILIGWGSVGQHISKNIQQAHIDLVIIEENREHVEQLRLEGFHAIAGDATHVETLIDAAISKAVAIVVAVPDPFVTRQIVENARSLKPDIRVLVEAENDEEYTYFQEQKVDLAVTGPREIGHSIVTYLHKLKVA